LFGGDQIAKKTKADLRAMSIDVAVKLSNLLTIDNWDATYAALQKVNSADFITQCDKVGIHDAVVAQIFYDALVHFVQGCVVGGWA